MRWGLRTSLVHLAERFRYQRCHPPPTLSGILPQLLCGRQASLNRLDDHHLDLLRRWCCQTRMTSWCFASTGRTESVSLEQGHEIFRRDRLDSPVFAHCQDVLVFSDDILC